MLFDRVAASLPTTDILGHTIARRRVLRNCGYIKNHKKPAHVPVNRSADKIIAVTKENPFDVAWQKREERRLKGFVMGDGRDWLILETKGTVATIIDEVAEKHGVLASDIIGKSRVRKIAMARREVFYRCTKETNFSLPTIGRLCGGFDHTTVIHGRDKFIKEGGVV